MRAQDRPLKRCAAGAGVVEDGDVGWERGGGGLAVGAVI